MPIGQLLELRTRNELEYLMENATESLHRRAPPCLELRQPDSTGTRRYFISPSLSLFWTGVISYGSNSIRDSLTDKQGNPLVFCNDPVMDSGCVVNDTTNQLIYKPAQDYVLNAAAAGDDYYTKISFTSCPVFMGRQILDVQQFNLARTVVAGHELAHALNVQHTTTCGDLMFTRLIPPQTPNGAPGRVTSIDVSPLPVTYSPESIQQMRLHEKQ